MTKRFATTVSGWGDERFVQQSRPIPFAPELDQIPRRKFYLAAELALFFRVLHAALHEEILLLFSSRGYLKPELLATACLGLLPRQFRPKIIFYGEMFEPDSGWRFQLERVLMQLVDRAVFRFALHSSAEIPVFAKLWQVDIDKVRSTGFFTKHRPTTQPVSIQKRGQHIFAGGTSFRDYAPLIAAARQLPEYPFIICTNRLNDVIQLPANVQVGFVSPTEYDELLNSAAAVVVPLQTDVHRCIGLLTYIQAMWAKQPVIVSDTLGVREFITDGETGLIVEGSPESYVKAIQYILAPEHQAWVDTMCEQAHEAVCTRFTIENHVSQLLRLVDEAVSSI